MNAKESLHTQLKHYRELKGLSKTEVANQLGLTRQAIQHWENGRSYPDLDNIVLLCELYEISSDELLGVSITPKLQQENSDILLESIVEAPSESLDTNKILGVEPATILEMLCLAVILVLSCQFTVIGMLAPILIAFWLKKTQRQYKLIYILCVVCFLVSAQNTLVVIEHFFKLGTTTVESM